MQLVAYGAEDLYLTGNPQITYWKVAYRRHTNFSMEYIEQYFETIPNFSTMNKTEAKIQIKRSGDMIFDTYLAYDLPNIRFPIENYPEITPEEVNFKWIKNIGQHIIDNVSIIIGGQVIDNQYGQWMNIWCELTVTDSKKESYNRLIGEFYKLRPGFSKYYPDKGDNLTIPATRLYIPLEFWFCKNPGLALPLIALQLHEIYIHVVFNPLNELFTMGPNNFSPAMYFSSENVNDSLPNSLVHQLLNNGYSDQNIFDLFISGKWNENTFALVNYIYLDDAERIKFAQNSHEYLIHQVQRRLYTGLQPGPNIARIDMFHPIKELIWVLQKDNVWQFNNWTNYTFLDLNNDYLQLQKEYNNKFDYLNHPQDTAFMQSINNTFIVPNEISPSINICNFLASNISQTEGFNDYTNILLNAKLVINGHDRFESRDNVFFNALQSYKYHTHSAPPGVYIYSFAIYPEQEQPSGTANFSRMNKVELQFNIRKDICAVSPEDEQVNNDNVEYNMFLYGLNYNILRIMGGMGGLAFQ